MAASPTPFPPPARWAGRARKEEAGGERTSHRPSKAGQDPWLSCKHGWNHHSSLSQPELSGLTKPESEGLNGVSFKNHTN